MESQLPTAISFAMSNLLAGNTLLIADDGDIGISASVCVGIMIAWKLRQMGQWESSNTIPDSEDQIIIGGHGNGPSLRNRAIDVAADCDKRASMRTGFPEANISSNSQIENGSLGPEARDNDSDATERALMKKALARVAACRVGGGAGGGAPRALLQQVLGVVRRIRANGCLQTGLESARDNE